MLEELLKFYENDTEPRRKEYIEMFLFAFHACGLRMVDVMTLEWKHINFEKKELKKVLIKTMKYQKQRHTIPLTETAEKILLEQKEIFVINANIKKAYIGIMLSVNMISNKNEE